MSILCNQRDATYTMFFIIIRALHVSGGFYAHHQELIKLYVQPWVLSRFSAVYRCCGWGGTPTKIMSTKNVTVRRMIVQIINVTITQILKVY